MTTNTTQEAKSLRDPFGLSRLPQPRPEHDAWPQIRAALRRRQQTRRISAWLASAALVTLTVGIYWQLPHVQEATVSTPPEVLVSAPSEAVPTGRRDTLESLIGLSQKLERDLRLMRAEIGVMPAQTLIYQVQLEDLVSEVDEAINRQPGSRALWSQRVNLLLDLNQLYQQQMRRDYQQIASL